VSTAWLRALLSDAADVVAPPACLFCELPLWNQPRFHGLCAGCFESVSRDPYPSCGRCASTIGPAEDTMAGCRHCDRTQFAFNGVLRLGPYSGLLRMAIVRAKQPGNCGLAETLGAIAAAVLHDRVLACTPNVVVPVPMHWRRRLVQRRYNHAEAIAQHIASALQLPLNTRVVKKNRSTPMQSSLSSSERRMNLQHAFSPRTPENMRGLRILLVDDVMTTGATLHAAAEACFQGGAAQVTALVVAHG
jgi:ComF family protein